MIGPYLYVIDSKYEIFKIFVVIDFTGSCDFLNSFRQQDNTVNV